MKIAPGATRGQWNGSKKYPSPWSPPHVNFILPNPRLPRGGEFSAHALISPGFTRGYYLPPGCTRGYFRCTPAECVDLLSADRLLLPVSINRRIRLYIQYLSGINGKHTADVKLRRAVKGDAVAIAANGEIPGNMRPVRRR
jgi:hypothetical protein